MTDETTSRRNGVVAGKQPVHNGVVAGKQPVRSAVRMPVEPGPMPSWADLRAVLVVCIPAWAGLTWLIAEWL